MIKLERRDQVDQVMEEVVLTVVKDSRENKPCSNMSRLDTLALKSVMKWTKDLYEDTQQHALIIEELSGKANVLWNIATTILRRDEPLGDEAIELMTVMGYLESTGKLWWANVKHDCLITLSNYNFVNTMNYPTEVVHRLFYDVICERNESYHEIDILRMCLRASDITPSQGFKHALTIPSKHVWKKCLMYPELVREFKSVGLDLCIKGYKRVKEPSFAKQTAEIFEELFGPTDEETVLLRSYEFRVIPTIRLLNQDDLLKLCREIRPTFEAYVTSMGVGGGTRILGKIYKAEYNVQSYVLEEEEYHIWGEEYFSEDFLKDSTVFCMSVWTIFTLTGDIEHIESLPLWLDMAKEYMNKMPRTCASIEFLKVLRTMILSDTSTLDSDIRLPFHITFIYVLTETVLIHRNSENAKESTSFKNEVNEELNTLLQIIHELGSEALCKERTDYTNPTFRQFMKMAWMILYAMDDLDGIGQSLMSVIESSNKVLEEMLEMKPIELRQFSEYWVLNAAEVLCAHMDFLQIVTTTADLDSDLKNNILEQCLIAGKNILEYCFHVPIEITKWMEYIGHCCLALNAFDEHENFLLENLGNYLMIANWIIDFGYQLTQKSKHDGTQDCVPLIQIALKSTEKYLSMWTDEDTESSRELKENVMEKITFCQTHIKNCS